jgi:predicted DNA-binding transcriptional regulator AlpA
LRANLDPFLTFIRQEEDTELSGVSTMERRMLGIQELPDYVGLSPQTIYNQLSAGTSPIKTERIGRRLKWDRRDVPRYLEHLPTIN